MEKYKDFISRGDTFWQNNVNRPYGPRIKTLCFSLNNNIKWLYMSLNISLNYVFFSDVVWLCTLAYVE